MSERIDSDGRERIFSINFNITTTSAIEENFVEFLIHNHMSSLTSQVLTVRLGQ